MEYLVWDFEDTVMLLKRMKIHLCPTGQTRETVKFTTPLEKMNWNLIYFFFIYF